MTTSARSRVHRAIAAALMLALVSALDLRAQVLRPRDDEVKAVYLLNFGRFARWPAAEVAAPHPAAFAVCLLGRDPFGSTLDTVIAGEKIDGQPVVTKRLASATDAAGCRILFISGSEAAHLKEIFQRVDRTPTLTVSDMPRFTEQGGMIQFVSEGSRIRFAVNVVATEQAGLMLSSELLRVAVAVKSAKSPGSER